MKKAKKKVPSIGRIPLPKQTETSFKDKTKYTRKEKRKSPAYSVGDFFNASAINQIHRAPPV